MSKKLLAVIVIIASVSALTLGAQENTGNSSEVLRKKGDQSITILAGGFIPLFVLDSTGALISPSNMYPGASFDVQYRYMLGKPHRRRRFDFGLLCDDNKRRNPLLRADRSDRRVDRRRRSAGI
jgi:hypothetical protein